MTNYSKKDRALLHVEMPGLPMQPSVLKYESVGLNHIMDKQWARAKGSGLEKGNVIKKKDNVARWKDPGFKISLFNVFYNIQFLFYILFLYNIYLFFLF